MISLESFFSGQELKYDKYKISFNKTDSYKFTSADLQQNKTNSQLLFSCWTERRRKKFLFLSMSDRDSNKVKVEVVMVTRNFAAVFSLA